MFRRHKHYVLQALAGNKGGDPTSWTLTSGGVKSTLDIDFVNDRAQTSGSVVTIASLLSCTRASPGYYTNADGTLTKKGDVARTNLVLRSQQLDNAAWSPSAETVTADQATAPDGTTTAELLVPSTSNAQHYTLTTAGITISNTTVYTFSCYAKPASYNFIQILGDAFGVLGDVTASFQLTGSGTVLRAPTGGSARITALANGWYRVEVTATSTNTTVSPVVAPYPSAAASFATFTGDGTSGVYVWGCQLEAQTAWNQSATAYIATTSAAVTVSAIDNVLRYGTNGLRVEEARINVAPYSQTFDNAAWDDSHANDTVTANTTVAPDGTTTADTIALTATGYRYGKSYAVSNETTNYTASVWMKGTAGDKVALRFYDGAANVVSATVITLTASWAQYTATANLVIDSLFIEMGFENRQAVVGALPNLAVTFQAWGFQMEKGAFATSYIPTTSASVSRAADVVTATSLSWLNQSAGTHYCEAVTPLDAGTQYKYLLNLHKTSAEDTNRQIVYRGFGSTAYAVDGQTGGTLSLSPGSVAQSSSIKVALAIAADNCACSINGANAVADSSVTIETDFDKYVFGNNIGFPDRAWNSYIHRFAYWNSRLSDGALQTLTT